MTLNAILIPADHTRPITAVARGALAPVSPQCGKAAA